MTGNYKPMSYGVIDSQLLTHPHECISIGKPQAHIVRKIFVDLFTLNDRYTLTVSITHY